MAPEQGRYEEAGMERRGLWTWLIALVGLTCVAGSIVVAWGARRPDSLPAPRSAAAQTPRPDTSPVATVERTPAPTPTAPPTPPAAQERRTSPSPEATLRAVTGVQPPTRDLLDLAVRFGRLPPDAPRVVPSPEYAQGDVETFWVGNIETTSFSTATAVLRLKTPHAYWWVETAYDVPVDDLRRAATAFEERILPTIRELFGTEWIPGVDGDPRLHVFMGNVPGVGGYFSGADEYPAAAIPFSNEKELFYINLESVWPGERAFDAILAHEYQHMVHWYQDRDEATWVNEGLSELAVTLSGVASGRRQLLRAFLDTPDVPLTRWVEPNAVAYGASLAFFEYLVDRFGRELVRRIVRQPANGAAGIGAALAPLGLSFEEVFADWAVANAVGDTPQGAGRAEPAAVHRAYPVEVEEATVHQFGADVILFEPPAGRVGTLEITFQGEAEVPLLPTAPRSGQYAFWSYRGDEMDSRLTRAFDLTGLERATLRFWAWYDIEEGYDYAYVLVSDDGGATWVPLNAEGTTDDNPNGNALGPGYTGASGCVGREEACEPRWQLYEADLTPFAGRRLLVRFEYVTDDALNRPGMVVDDIAIPELGYREDFEAGAGGWNPEGWVRVGPSLPQEYVVQAVVFRAGEYDVVRLALNRERRGRVTVPGFGADVERVLLVVSGVTPVTPMPAQYGYTANVVGRP